MPRVLLDVRVLNTSQPTGLSRYAATLFARLTDRRRFEYFVADGEAGLVPGARSLPFDVPLADSRAASTWFAALCRLYEIDLLFSPYLPVPALAGTRVVLTVHDVIALSRPEWFADGSVHRFFDGPLRESAKAADRLIAGSRAAASDVAARYDIDPARIVVVPHAASPAFAPAARDRTNGVRTPICPPAPFVLSVATLEPRKNIERLVAAYERLRERSPDVRSRLLLVGRLGWNCGTLLDRIALSPFRDDIIHVGHVDDEALVDLYRACHVLAYPTLAEGFGLPVLEALACGCVVVTSDIPVIREVAAEAACYCDPLSVDSMAEALWRATSDGELRARLRGASTRRAAMFDWEQTAAATERVFDDALGRV